MSPEEELPVQVGDLDLIHVGDLELAQLLIGRRDAHHGKVLQQLTADRARSHDEPFLGEHRLLEVPTEYGRLAVVTRSALKKKKVFNKSVLYFFKVVLCISLDEKLSKRTQISPASTFLQ